MPMHKVAFDYLDKSLDFKLGVEKGNEKWNAVVPACPRIPPQHKGWSCTHEEGCNKNCVLFVPCWTEVASSDLSLNFRYVEKRVHPTLVGKDCRLPDTELATMAAEEETENCSRANC